MGDPGRRRNVWLPDDLWDAIVEASAKETVRTGEQVSASEWIRRAILAALKRSE